MKHVTDYLEKPDINRILDAARACNSRDYLIIRVLWRSGIRASELLGIVPAAIEWHNGIINIVNGKGDKERRVFVDSETLHLLKEYVAENNINDDLPIFDIQRRQLYNICKKYGEISGIDKAHPHIFRHSYAINMVRHGVDIRRLQQVLGHASLNTTAVYLQFNDKDIQDVYEQVPF